MVPVQDLLGRLCVLCVQVDQYVPEPKALHLFQQLESLMAAQEDTIAQVRTAGRVTTRGLRGIPAISGEDLRG